jgi:hypothetical protein
VKAEHREREFKVVDIISPSRLVLNCGTNEGVDIGDAFQVYAHGKMISDPDTQEDIEALEIPRGPGKVIYVQRKLCTLESTSMTTRTVKKEAPTSSTLESLSRLFASQSGIPGVLETETRKVRLPFEGPQLGDRARFIERSQMPEQ